MVREGVTPNILLGFENQGSYILRTYQQTGKGENSDGADRPSSAVIS